MTQVDGNVRTAGTTAPGPVPACGGTGTCCRRKTGATRVRPSVLLRIPYRASVGIVQIAAETTTRCPGTFGNAQTAVKNGIAGTMVMTCPGHLTVTTSSAAAPCRPSAVPEGREAGRKTNSPARRRILLRIIPRGPAIALLMTRDQIEQRSAPGSRLEGGDRSQHYLQLALLHNLGWRVPGCRLTRLT